MESDTHPETHLMEPGSGVVPVADLLGEELSYLRLNVLSGQSHLDNLITHPRVQKPGLAFAGYYAYIKPGRVQIIGESEAEYLKTLNDEERLERLDCITSLPVPVFVITKGLPPLPGFLSLCQNREVPVLSSPALSSNVIKGISYFLEDHLVPSTSLHGVLLEIYGLGVLLIGESGVGKSESALDLITRGHSLVADDKVTGQALSERRAGRLQRGAAAPPHGAAGDRDHQRPGPVRPRLRARADHHRPGDRAGALARRPAPTTGSASTRPCSISWRPPAPTSACRSPWGATSASWSRSRRATTC